MQGDFKQWGSGVQYTDGKVTTMILSDKEQTLRNMITPTRVCTRLPGYQVKVAGNWVPEKDYTADNLHLKRFQTAVAEGREVLVILYANATKSAPYLVNFPKGMASCPMGRFRAVALYKEEWMAT